MLTDHVTELARDSEVLLKSGRPRGKAILDAVRGEEAAKALIPLDLIRHGREDAPARKTLMAAFSDHVARGIYITVASGSPATLLEVRDRADLLRRGQYLDGPNDFEWTFRTRSRRRARRPSTSTM
jgi:hypothetical protein